MPHEVTRAFGRRHPNRVGALGLLTLALLLSGCETQADKDKKAADAAYREKLAKAKAKAIFAERCKTAGVVIHRTVKDVEGIAINKVRPELEYADKRYFDPMWSEAAMATEARGDDYIKQFLLSEISTHFREPKRRGNLFPPNYELPNDSPARHLMSGYRYVDYIDPIAASTYRISLLPHPTIKQTTGPLKREPLKGAHARYLLDYEDLLDPADRAYWIAGSKLSVIDQENGEVIAHFTQFLLDPGFGSSASGRWPWSTASGDGDYNCPKRNGQPTSPVARYFVDTVLIPRQGD